MRTLTYTFLLIAALVSCTGNRATRALLDHADTLADTCPDSALALLASISTSPDSLPEALLMRYRLLQAKALNKTFIPFTTDTTMTAVVEWYDRHGNRRERMMARYLLGCVYRDLNDAPTALEHYNMAASLADTTDAGCDWHTLCRIHGQMAELFSDMGSPIYELRADSLSMIAAWKAKDTIMALKTYELQVGAYYAMSNEDSVISITRKVVDIYRKLNREDLAACALPTLIYVYLNRNEFAKAKKCMNYFEQHSGLFDDKGNIIAGRELYYDAKVIYYWNIGNDDSTYIYLRKLQKSANDIMCAEAAYKGLMNFYAKRHETDSVTKYSQLYCRMNDSSTIVRAAEEISRTQAIYNYNYAQRQMNEKVEEAKRYRLMLILIIFSAILISMAVYKIYSVKKQKRHKEITEINNKYTQLWGEYDKAVREQMLMKSDFEQYKANKSLEIKTLKESILAYHDNNLSNDIADTERELRNCETSIKLHTLAAKGHEATENELAKVSMLVKNELTSFHATINAPEHKLNEREIYVCVLIRLCFIPSEIAVLLNLSLQSITNIRSRINKKLFNQDGTRQLDTRLKML